MFLLWVERVGRQLRKSLVTKYQKGREGIRPKFGIRTAGELEGAVKFPWMAEAVKGAMEVGISFK